MFLIPLIQPLRLKALFSPNRLLILLLGLVIGAAVSDCFSFGKSVSA